MFIKYDCKFTKIFLNGAWVGLVTNPIDFVNILKLHRRNNIIYIYTSILFDMKRNEVQIWVDAGRPCRPLFYIENGLPSYINDTFMNKLDNNNLSWKEIFCGIDKEYNEFSILDINENIKNLDSLRNHC